MIYESSFNGLPVKTGDIICTSNGKPDILPGEFWRLIGRLLPGEVDHIVIYLGPQGRCAEAGSLGVITFEMPGMYWQSEKVIIERGLLVDELYGVVYPLQQMSLTNVEEMHIRQGIAAYCLANLGKPYNLNFMDAEREDAFYCSQLAYKAYQTFDINLNTGLAMENMPGSDQIVFPQEIWNGFPHRGISVLDHSL